MDIPLLTTEEAYPIHPNQLPPIPRIVDTTSIANWKRGALLGALLLLPNLILLYGLVNGKDLRDLIDHGESSTGRIVDRKVNYHSRGGSTYHVRYRYEVKQRNYEGEASVTKANYEAMPNGTQHEITYLPEQPEVSCMGKPDPWQKKRINSILMLAGVAALLLGGWFGWVEWGVRRELHLARAGHGVVGMVIDRGSTQTKNGVRYWTQYQFQGPDRWERKGTTTVPKEIWDELQLGTQATILFDPDNPGRHQPLYAFKHVRILRPVEEERELAYNLF